MSLDDIDEAQVRCLEQVRQVLLAGGNAIAGSLGFWLAEGDEGCSWLELILLRLRTCGSSALTAASMLAVVDRATGTLSGPATA